jgi:hypothetical protein
MTVPYTFATATTSIPLSQLDSNFATAITLGNTAVYLGNTTTSLGNLTLTNATISTVATTFPNSFLANSSLTIGTTNISLGGTTSSLANVTLSNVTISSGSINITNVSVSNITVTGGTIDGTAIGSTSASTGKFTTLTDTGLTSGRVPYAGTAGLIQDAAALTFDGTILSATRFAGALNGTVGATTPSTGAFTTLSGTGQLTLTNASNYNLYASGAGANYFAGNVGIGVVPPTFQLDVQSSASTPAINVATTASNESARLRIVGKQGTTDNEWNIVSTGAFVAGAQLRFVAGAFTNAPAIAISSASVTSIGAAPGSESLRVTPVASAVNYWDFYGGATGVDPYFFPSGSDTNRGFIYLTKGTGTHRFMTGSSLTNTQFAISNTASAVNYITAFGNTAGSGGYFQAAGSDTNISMLFSAKGTGNHDFYTGGNSFTRQVSVAHTASAVNYLQVTGGATGGAPNILAAGSDSVITLGMSSKGSAPIQFRTDSFAGLQFTVAHTASAVNYLQVTGGATGGGPAISVQGGDTNISMAHVAKGLGGNYFQSAGANQFSVDATSSAVNWISATGGITGSPAVLNAAGSDTNVSIKLIPKGTGTVQFGTYTAGIIAQAGYITITDAGGTSRRLLVG